MTADEAPRLELSICSRCGCLVADKEIHTEYHRRER